MAAAARYRRMFHCDNARISKVVGKMFLIIGKRRNTKDDPPEHGKWYKNGELFDFEYLAERVIASGDTEAELLKAAKAYKRMLNRLTPFSEVLR